MGVDQLAAYNPVLKKWEIVPCAGLLAMDVATRKVLTFLLKPRFTLPRSRSDRDTSALTAEELAKDEDTRRIAITRADMREMLRVIFNDEGMPVDYATAHRSELLPDKDTKSNRTPHSRYLAAHGVSVAAPAPQPSSPPAPLSERADDEHPSAPHPSAQGVIVPFPQPPRGGR